MEVIILSTCNRSEVYFVAEEAEKLLQTVRQNYLDFLNAQEYSSYVYSVTGEVAVKHLFQVAADAHLVIGEDQILGQVRDSFEFLPVSGQPEKYPISSSEEAITLSKRIKTELKISSIPLSVSYIGIKLLSDFLGGIYGKNILVVGMGKMNSLSMKYLQEQGAKTIYVCSNSKEKLQQLVKSGDNIVAVDYVDRYRALPSVDAVITATASPHTVFCANKISAPEKPLCFLDIAVPEDVEPSVREIPNVTVYNMDDIKLQSENNLEKRLAIARQAEQYIETATNDVIEWIRLSRADPTIRSLNERCTTITEDTTSYLFNKLDLPYLKSLSFPKMIYSSLRRLIREPVEKLKETKSQDRQGEFISTLEELFDLKRG